MSARAAQGYGMVAVSYLLIALSGTLVTWATAPASTLLVLRFAVAVLVLGAVFARRRRLAGIFASGLWSRLLLMGAFDAAALLLFFVAVRETSVAIATFFLFIQPVWIALAAIFSWRRCSACSPRPSRSASSWTAFATSAYSMRPSSRISSR